MVLNEQAASLLSSGLYLSSAFISHIKELGNVGCYNFFSAQKTIFKRNNSVSREIQQLHGVSWESGHGRAFEKDTHGDELGVRDASARLASKI